MNNKIFIRDSYKEKRKILVNFSERKHEGAKKEMFKDFKPLYIEKIIDDLSRKMQGISTKQSKWNKIIPAFIFTKSFVLKEFERRRIKI